MSFCDWIIVILFGLIALGTAAAFLALSLAMVNLGLL